VILTFDLLTPNCFLVIPAAKVSRHSTDKQMVTDPKVWNNLPATLRQPDVEFGQFEQLLKTFLFGEAAAH